MVVNWRQMVKNLFNSFVFIYLLVFLVGCSSGGSSSSNNSDGDIGGTPTPTIGAFVDSYVEGLTYHSSPSGLTGLTDAQGRYEFETGDTVTFSIGCITLESSATGEFVTPMSVFPDNMEAAINLAQLLQSIDSDGDPSNGITPDEALLADLCSVDFEDADFDNFLDQNLPAGVHCVTDGEAMRHMEESFAQHNINNDGSIQITTRLFVGGDEDNGLELWTTDATGDIDNFQLVKDIIEGGSEGSDPGDTIAFNGNIYFTANDGIHGEELWITDGTEDGTRLLKDITEGTTGSNGVNDFTVANNILYFTADDGIHGIELWRTNGTTDGTFMVEDLAPGSDNGFPSYLTVANNILFFKANIVDGGPHSLWKVDTSGDISEVQSDMNALYEMVELNGKVYFSGNHDVNVAEYWLWESDGTTTVPKIKFINSCNFLTAVGDRLFFKGGDFGTLYVTNSAIDSATEVEKDTGGAFFVGGVYANGNNIYLRANDGANGYELWKSDGTNAGSMMIKDIWDGVSAGVDGEIVVMGSNAYFRANDGVHGRELWKSDGTEVGTVMVKDIKDGGDESYPKNLIVMGSSIYFSANDGIHGEELWKTDGMEVGTVMIKDINNGETGSNAYDFAVMGSSIYFTADNGIYGTELWKTDGTEVGTVIAADVNKIPTSSLETDTKIIRAGDKFYFTVDSGDDILWVSDGTDAGTYSLEIAISTFEDSVVLGDELVFSHNPDDGDRGLWKTDGTISGTAALFEIGGLTSYLTVVGDTLFFIAYEDSVARASVDYALWKTDGTVGGTELVYDTDGHYLMSPSFLTKVGGRLFFRSYNNTERLYVTDGTAAGTVLIVEAEVAIGDAKSIDETINDFENLTSVGNTLFFSARTNNNGTELWKTDGTADGTVMVKDINVEELDMADVRMDARVDVGGNSSSSPKNMTNVNGTLYFTADDGVHGRELWKSDGTPEGTVIVKDIVDEDIRARMAISSFTIIAVVDDKLYFNVVDNSENTETLWVTYQGTNLTQQVNLDVDLNDFDIVSRSKKVKARDKNASRGKDESAFLAPHYEEYLLLWLNYNGHYILKKISGSFSETVHDVTLTDDD